MASLNNKNRLPFDSEAEKAVIGCMINYKNTVDLVLSILSADSFYVDLYKTIFVCIDELSKKGTNVDFVTVRDKMLQKNIDPNEISNDFFADLVDSAATIANITDYCNIVQDKYLLRTLIEKCDEAIVASRKNEEDAEDIIANIEKEIFELQKYNGQKQYHLLKELWPQLFDKITNAMNTKDGITGVPTGFKELDNLTSGFQPSNFIVIAARPAMGKTALALNMAFNMAFKKNKRVAFFSLEMSSLELAMRLLASETHISSDKIRSGRLTNDDLDMIYSTVERLVGDNLVIDDTSFLTIAELRNKCRKLQSDKGLDIVMIDYLQLMHAGKDGYNSKLITNRQEEVAQISRALKGLAKELDIPVVALAQVKRPDDKNPPDLADLRESGAIEQDADFVMFIHRDTDSASDETEDKQYNSNITTLYVRKHRNGSLKNIPLRFDKSTTKYNDVSYDKTPFDNSNDNKLF